MWVCSVPHCVWLFCDPMDYSPLGSSVHGISQARILEWVAIPFPRGSRNPSMVCGGGGVSVRSHSPATFAFRLLCQLQHVRWTRREILKVSHCSVCLFFSFQGAQQIFQCVEPSPIILQVWMTLAWFDRWSSWTHEAVKWLTPGPRAWKRPLLELNNSWTNGQVSCPTVHTAFHGANQSFLWKQWLIPSLQYLTVDDC